MTFRRIKLTNNRLLKGDSSAFNLVRVVRRELEPAGQHLIGVIIGIGKQWIILARMNDAIRMDGFDAIRLADVSTVEESFFRRTFYVRGLQGKRAKVANAPRLNLDTTEGLLRSVQKWFPVLTIDRELVNPGACEIGRITRLLKRDYRMRSMNPSGEWAPEDDSYRLEDVTRVGFDGEYEGTLASVAGLRDLRWVRSGRNERGK